MPSVIKDPTIMGVHDVDEAQGGGDDYLKIAVTVQVHHGGGRISIGAMLGEVCG